MLRAFLIIDFPDDLLFVVNGPLPIGDLTTWIVRFRHTGADVLRYGTEQSRINTVVDERRSERDRASCVTGRRCKRRKIAGKHRGCWNKTSDVCRVLADFGALKPAKEKDLVFDHWPA